MVKICIYCGCSFKTNSKRSKYCSRECVNNSMRGTRKSNTHLWENKYKICENCNEKFFVHSAQENKHRFCSKKCSAQWRGKYNKNSYNVTREMRDICSRRFKNYWRDESFKKMVKERMLNNNPSKNINIVIKQNNSKKINNTIGFTGDKKYLRGGNGKKSNVEQLIYDFMYSFGFIYNYAIGTKDLSRLYPEKHFATNYKPDYVYQDKKICIEIDGSSHKSKLGRERDSKKEFALNWYGYSVFRFENDFILNNLEDFKRQILNLVGYKTEFVKSVNVIEDVDFVYDIEVKDNHNYFGNNILVHNCKNAQSQQRKRFNGI